MTEATGRPVGQMDEPDSGIDAFEAHAGPERTRRRELLRRAGVYLVTEESLSLGRRSEDVAEAALANGVRVIQVREKEGTARRALEIAIALRRLTRDAGALLIVNDRVDIALAAEADGVHLGQGDLPIAAARRLMGEDALIGLSITETLQLGLPDAVTADCLGVGAIFPTGSKPDASWTGLGLLGTARATVERQGIAQAGATVRRSAPPPIVAIGGITLENAGRAVLAGADVVAVISAITRAPDPGRATAELMKVVREAGVERASRAVRAAHDESFGATR